MWGRQGLLAYLRAWLSAAAMGFAALAGPAAAHDPGAITEIARLPAGVDPDAAAVVAGVHDSAFVPLTDKHLLRVERRPSWWRVRVAPPRTDEDRVLAIYEPYSARVTAWLPPDYHRVTRRIYDRDLPRRWSRHALVFALDDGAAGVAYLRIEGARGYPLKVTALDEALFAARDLAHVRIAVAVLAGLAAIGVAVLLFWLLLRERVYFLFFAYLLFQAMFLAVVTGEAHRIPLLASFYAEFGPKSQWVLATLAFALSLSFLQEFAELRHYAGWLSRLMTFAAALLWVLLAAVVVPMPFPAERLPPFINSAILVANAAAFAALGVAAWRGGRAARYVLAAWLPVLALSTWRTIQLNLGFELPDALEYALPVATTFATIVLCMGLADRMLAFRRERDSAQAEAARDALTGVLNRKAAMQWLTHAFDAARRRGDALAVLYLDLDHFKRINDTLGHSAGDACLRAVVENVKRELRHADLVGRWGGEEFVVAIADASLPHASAVAERIRANVEFRCRDVSGHVTRLTVSIGVAAIRAGDTRAEALIERADQALYDAKRSGRNRVAAEAAADPAPAAA